MLGGRPRSFALRAALVAGAWLALAAPRDALAFCRSTTCTGDCPRDADGCKTSGTPLAWTGGCVSFSLQEDSSVHIPLKYFRQVATRSFVAWSELDCDAGLSSLLFSEADDVACHEAEYNPSGTNANVLLFQDTKWRYSGVDNTLAKTTVTFDDDTGEILDADIEINHANNNFTINDDVVDYDLEAVLTHEVGHFIGLDHTPDFTATMYAGYEPGTIDGRSLEPDDVLAACAAYPPSRDVTCDPTPRGGLAYDCGGVPNGNDLSEDPGPGCTACASSTRSLDAQSTALFATALAAAALRSRRRVRTERATIRPSATPRSHDPSPPAAP